MTGTEMDRFGVALTARLAELERVTRNRAVTIERSADQPEEINAAPQRTLAVCDLDRDLNQLRDARAALHRLAEGNVGVCQECDQSIHPMGLAAVPWAPFCFWCQEALNRNLGDIQPPKRDLLGRAA